MYEEIKQNLIKKFLAKYYLWTFCSNKANIIADMNDKSPFDITPSKDCNSIEMDLGNAIIIKFNLKWEEKKFANSDTFGYRLIEIN